MSWETVIGLEIHAQLLTESKIFSPAPTLFTDKPNTQVREVDWGLPGALPVLNDRAVDCALRLGIALSADINKHCEFARKNYFYPDLPKGYQISQFEYPIVGHGELWINGTEDRLRIGVTRAHLEEDAGKLVHEGWKTRSGVDLNRAGTPLLEIVSEPDLRHIADAVTYAVEMHKLVQWLDICDGNMQEGSFRIDANISVRRAGEALGTRCEIKNLNSFRFLEQALKYERERQISLIEEGGTVVQETRLFDTENNRTRTMRSKEDAHDYRYFPDPDLPPLVIDDRRIQHIKAHLPELPEACRQRLMADYQLSAYDAGVLTSSKGFFNYYEAVLNAALKNGGDKIKTAKLCANWLSGDFSALLNEHKTAAATSIVSSDDFADLIRHICDGNISGKTAKSVLTTMFASGDSPSDIIKREGLQQISDGEVLEKLAREIIDANPKQVEQYRGGKDKLFGFFVGQMMKATGGQAHPEQTNTILKRLLDSQ